MKPYTLYEFKVRTHDHNNLYGPYSQTVECHTLEDGKHVFVTSYGLRLCIYGASFDIIGEVRLA